MNIEIANRLQKLRKERGLSQEQLADELGISRQAVSKWERAESSPDTDNLICLAKLYGVSLDYLLSTDDTIEEIKETQIVKEEMVEKELLKKEYNDFDDEDEESVLTNVFSVIIVFGSIIAYILMGTLSKLWHPGWIIFVFFPALITLVEAISKKDARKFAYPIFVCGIYLLLGCIWNLWHPGWLIFLTIPVYYGIFDVIYKNNKKDTQAD